MINPYSCPLRRHLLALLWIAPALAAAWALPAEAPYAHMLFDGGAEVFRHNLCEFILIPYVCLFMLAVGTLLLPAPPAAAGSRLTSTDFELIRFFGGAGVLVIFGFALGVANLLFAWVTVLIFAAVLYLYLLASPAPLARFLGWLGTTDLRERRLLRAVGLLCRGVVCLLVLLVVVEKGIAINLNQNDALQLYFPYFAEVRRLHGIWLDPAQPIIFGFFVGRGHGAQLFFTSFTDQFFIQAVSVVYFVSIAMVVRRVVCAIVPGRVVSSSWLAACALFPDCAVLLALSSPLLQLDSGKFHFETGAFLMFLSWASLLFVFTDAKQARWLGFMLLPVALALPILISQTQAVATLIFTLAAVVVWQTKGKQFARIAIWLILAGCTMTALSLLVNQLYIGLAEINPYQLFVKFIDSTRFRQWSSEELLVYVSNAQGFSYVNDWGRIVDTFLASIGKLGEAGRIDIRRTEFSMSTLPVVLFALLAALGFPLLGYLRRQRAGAGQLLDEGADVFIVGFFSMYVMAALLISLSGHGSLQRLMSYLDAYPAIFLILAFVLFGTAFERFASGAELTAAQDQTPALHGGLGAAVGRMRGRCGIALVMVICALSLVFAAFNVRTKQLGVHERIHNLTNEVSYFFGDKSLINIIDGMPVHYDNERRFGICPTIGKIIPSGERVLPLNSIFGVVPACSYSPLLPRAQVQDTLHYVFARQFRRAVLGDPAESYAIFKDYHVNYFLVEKGDPYFWGPGVSDNFSAENLAANFDVYYEDDRAYIFTWRGKGTGAVSAGIAAELRGLQDGGRRATPYYYQSLRDLQKWIADNAGSEARN